MPKVILPEDKLAIDVRRECVLEDAIREGKKKKFNCHKCLKVRCWYKTHYTYNLCSSHALVHMHKRGIVFVCLCAPVVFTATC